ncbi:Anaerobic regulatory protein [compost metagenome]
MSQANAPELVITPCCLFTVCVTNISSDKFQWIVLEALMPILFSSSICFMILIEIKLYFKWYKSRQIGNQIRRLKWYIKLDLNQVLKRHGKNIVTLKLAMISKFIFNNQYILNELPQCDKDLLERVMQSKKYVKNQTVFTEGTLPTGIFYIQTGKIKKFKVDNEGREQIIYIYNSGEFFGYTAILSEQAYGDTAEVIENSIISFIAKDDFFNVLNNSVVFSRLLLKCLSHEFSVMANLMAVLSQRTVRERVALSLLILHDKYKINDDQKDVFITLSRGDLANMVGTVNETLARVLHDFKNENLIWMEGRKIQLMNFQQLIHIANFY